jgi:competence protein ComEA
MRRDDSHPARRVGRLLDRTAVDDGIPPGWPAPADADAPDGAAGSVGHHHLIGPPRWTVSAAAAASAAVLTFVVIVVATFMLWRTGSSGTVLPEPDPSSTAGPGVLGASAGTGGSASGDPALSLAGAAGTPSGTAASPGPPAGQVRVYVVGQVRHPGVVSLVNGARVEDAVKAAGGATERADLAVINLARKVQDGEQIVVPKPGETVPAAALDAGGGAGGAGAGGTGGDGTAGGGPGAPIDLNTATVAQLDTLPGVGPVIAGRIVAWRQDNGRFATVDDLGEVSGIGEATLAKLRPLVRV